MAATVTGIAALALGAWLAAPIHAPAVRAPLSVCLVDVSASVVRTRPDWRSAAERAVARESARAGGAGAEFAAIAYADDVTILDPSEVAGEPYSSLTAGDSDVHGDLSSDLAGALDLVASLRGERNLVRLALWSDREWTGRDPAPALARLVSQGTEVEWLELPRAESTDVALVDLRAPPRIEAGAPLSVIAAIATRTRGAFAPVRLRVECEARDAEGVRTSERTLAVPLGEEASAVRIDLGAARAGWTRVRARVTADGGSAVDPVTENDVAFVSVHSGDAPVVGVLAIGDDGRSWARRMQAWSGLDVHIVPVGEVTTALADLDALVSVDLDPRALPLASIEDFVRRGGGFLACGGSELLGAMLAVPEELDLLPFELEHDGDGPRDVVLLVDRSGSMSGETFEAVRAAAVELALAAAPGDSVVVRGFTDRLDPALQMRAAGERAERGRIERRVSALTEPGGPTDVLACLESLAAERAAGGPGALVLLLSDGRDQAARGATPQRCALARGKLESARVELEVLAFGASADLAFLGALAGERGLRRAEAEADLAAVFVRALADRHVVESPGPVALADAPAPGSLAADVSDAIRASSPGLLPPIERLLAVRAKKGSESIATASGGRTVLALRDVGLGFSAAWASSPDPGWGDEWTGPADVLAPLVRALSRGRAEGALDLSASFEKGDLVLEGVPFDWPARARFEVRARGADHRGEIVATGELEPPRTAPGDDPLRLRIGRVHWIATLAARAAETAVLDAGGTELARIAIPPAVPDEFAWPPRRSGWKAHPAEEARSNQATTPARSPRRPAIAWIAAGVASLALGAWLRLRAGQGNAPLRR